MLAVPRKHDSAGIAGWSLPKANVDKEPHQAAHHLMAKRVGSNLKDHHVLPFVAPTRIEDIPIH
jgi:hypothetical protein